MKNYKKIYSILLFASLSFFALLGYVNWGMPHGPMINTGYEECIEDAKGNQKCGDRYVEDTRRLNIPEWAKFLKDNREILVLVFLVMLIFSVGKLDRW